MLRQRSSPTSPRSSRRRLPFSRTDPGDPARQGCETVHIRGNTHAWE
jgi:hypothetical protein